MKEIWKNGVVVLLVIAVLYIIFLRECKKPDPCPAKDEIIVPLDVWNKIQELANKPPVTHIDTVYIKGETVYVYKELPVAVPNPADTTINSYSDSLYRKDIDVTYNFEVRGVLLNRSWMYKPIITEVFRTDSIFVPQLVEVPLKVPQNGLFLYGIAGGNDKSFLFGGGLDFITKKNTEIGYMYQRFGTDNFHSVKVGIKLFR
jgi:hypothetical protein